MAIPTVYGLGTISVAANSAVVSGVGTLWLSAGLQAGDVFSARGLSVTIDAIHSNTALTLVEPWPGAALSAAAYEIRPTPDATRVLTSAREALRKVAEGDLIDLESVVIETGAPGASVTFSNGVLTVPRGKDGAVDFGEVTVATGAPGTQVTFSPSTGTLVIPRGSDGDVTSAQLSAVSTPSYATRAAAEAAASGLPSAITQIIVREGASLVVRSRSASADDPLYASGARWGVTFRSQQGIDVFPSLETGRAAVADGQQFEVSSGGEIIRYRRDSATTQTEVERFPSAAGVNRLAGMILSSGVSVYRDNGIALGEYYAARRITDGGTLTAIYAEAIGGGRGAWAEFYLEVGGAPVSGPYRVESGLPLYVTGLAISVAVGDSISFSITALSGAVMMTEIIIRADGGAA